MNSAVTALDTLDSTQTSLLIPTDYRLHGSEIESSKSLPSARESIMTSESLPSSCSTSISEGDEGNNASFNLPISVTSQSSSLNSTPKRRISFAPSVHRFNRPAPKGIGLFYLPSPTSQLLIPGESTNDAEATLAREREIQNHPQNSMGGRGGAGSLTKLRRPNTAPAYTEGCYDRSFETPTEEDPNDWLQFSASLKALKKSSVKEQPHVEKTSSIEPHVTECLALPTQVNESILPQLDQNVSESQTMSESNRSSPTNPINENANSVETSQIPATTAKITQPSAPSHLQETDLQEPEFMFYPGTLIMVRPVPPLDEQENADEQQTNSADKADPNHQPKKYSRLCRLLRFKFWRKRKNNETSTDPVQTYTSNITIGQEEQSQTSTNADAVLEHTTSEASAPIQIKETIVSSQIEPRIADANKKDEEALQISSPFSHGPTQTKCQKHDKEETETPTNSSCPTAPSPKGDLVDTNETNPYERPTYLAETTEDSTSFHSKKVHSNHRHFVLWHGEAPENVSRPQRAIQMVKRLVTLQHPSTAPDLTFSRTNSVSSASSLNKVTRIVSKDLLPSQSILLSPAEPKPYDYPGRTKLDLHWSKYSGIQPTLV